MTVEEYYNEAVKGTDAGNVIEDSNLKTAVLVMLKNYHEVELNRLIPKLVEDLESLKTNLMPTQQGHLIDEAVVRVNKIKR